MERMQEANMLLALYGTPTLLLYSTMSSCKLLAVGPIPSSFFPLPYILFIFSPLTMSSHYLLAQPLPCQHNTSSTLPIALWAD